MPSFSLNDEQVLKKNKILSTEVKQIKLIETKGIVHLVNSFGNASFEARNIGRAAKLYHNKLRTDTSIIWSLSGSLFSAGLRQITIDAIRKNCVDALVCTGALF